MARKFHVVSKYESETIKKPARATVKSAGYDIYNNTGSDIILQPGEISPAITTKIKIEMEPDDVCMFFVRSGHGFKYSVRLANSTGIIDSDYFNNEKNEGECFVKFHNQGEYELSIKDGEAMAQAIFSKYLLTDDDSETVGGIRAGGIGSTTK